MRNSNLSLVNNYWIPKEEYYSSTILHQKEKISEEQLIEIVDKLKDEISRETLSAILGESLNELSEKSLKNKYLSWRDPCLYLDDMPKSIGGILIEVEAKEEPKARNLLRTFPLQIIRIASAVMFGFSMLLLLLMYLSGTTLTAIGYTFSIIIVCIVFMSMTKVNMK